ncbi:TonB-dependent receptor [Citrobacter freundii]|nr:MULTISPECIES: TonB-dependent receptor [Pseudomonadota]MBD5682079.1 TonB-dependent receptor [Citrobacter freundii]UTA15205.1 TonB-dependent receptor [Enterobacter cloacae]MBO8398542.1 TonB-dependent receptor [Pseudomonas aeruginosa]MBO8398645.1 TonB-dependent receptor [Pseudomonas aeruginosa]NGG61329.1 TonB-dependent receptor [Enterobacter hormaechei]
MCPICAQSGACAAASYPPDSQKRAVELPIPKVGAGVKYVGKTSDGTAYLAQNGVVLNNPLQTPAYTLFDLMAGYEFGRYDISVQVQNLTDKTVITSCLARGDCFYGQRRAVNANLRYRF